MQAVKQLQTERINSPIGTILMVIDQGKLCALDYLEYEARMIQLLTRRYGAFELTDSSTHSAISQQVTAYFAGDLQALDSIAVDTGGTAFQQQVWSALRTIPTGATATYGQLAARVGRPTAYRAVGMTNSLNPVAIVLPCHRVIGAKNALTGYAGGLARKEWLLRHEGVLF